MEEMLEDTMEMMDDTEDLDEDVQVEVDKVLAEITLGDKGKKLANVPKLQPEETIHLPEPGERELEEEEDTQEDLEEMQERLQALKS
jgi:charged multivesicular body protein 3